MKLTDKIACKEYKRCRNAGTNMACTISDGSRCVAFLEITNVKSVRSSDLLVCPFCGKSASATSDWATDVQLKHYGESVGCKSCDIFLDSKEAWNIRVI